MNVDVVFLICILIGFLFGLLDKWFKSLMFYAIFFVAFFIVVKGGFLSGFSNFIRYGLFKFLQVNFGMPKLEFDLTQSFGFTLRIETLEELLLLTQNFGLDATEITTTVDLICQCLSLCIMTIVIFLGAWLVSTILYFCLFRWILPKFLRKGPINRALGGIVGGAGEAMVFLIFLAVFISPLIGINNNILIPLQDSSSSIYKLVNDLNPSLISQSSDAISQLSNFISLYNPLGDQSTLCKAIYNSLNSIGLDPFYIISTKSEETNESISFANYFDSFLSGLVSKLSEDSSSVAGA